MYLILIETSGNQNYIFSTNKLRENIGASELTYRACTQWVLEAVAKNGGSRLWTDNNQQLRTNLLNQQSNQPVEVILAASSKAMLLTKERDTATAIVKKVTRKALESAPGLDICGVIQEFDWKSDCLGEVNRKIHQKFEDVRSRLPSPNTRFLRSPVVQECATSGLPAAELYPEARELEPRSAVSQAKRKSVRQAFERIVALLKQRPFRAFHRATSSLSVYFCFHAVIFFKSSPSSSITR